MIGMLCLLGNANAPFFQLLSQPFDLWAGQTGSATLKTHKTLLHTSSYTISTDEFRLQFHVWACFTQAVAHDWNRPDKLWVTLFEESVQSVDLRGYRVHYGLAIGGAVVEEQV